MKAFFLVLIFLTGTSAVLSAKPKERVFDAPADQLFQAALTVAREHHVVTYVDKASLTFTFSSGVSLTSWGFVANVSVKRLSPKQVEQAWAPDLASVLVINVQKKGQLFAWGAGGRLAEKFFKRVKEELAVAGGDTGATKDHSKN